jgi:DNA polymerase III subunit alpha
MSRLSVYWIDFCACDILKIYSALLLAMGQRSMVHLEAHSQYSFMSGTASVRQLVARAVEHGLSALALTDRDGLYGAIPFYQAAKAAGVRPILGAQLGALVVLAKDRTGYGQLCAVVTAYQLAQVTLAGLAAWPFEFGDEHLFILSADQKVLRDLHARGLHPLASVCHYGDGPSRGRASSLREWARRMGLAAAAVNPVHFLEEDDYRIHRVLSAIRTRTTVDTVPPEALAQQGDFFRSPTQMERLYADWPELIDQSLYVAEECQLDLEMGTPQFPDFPLPAGETAFSLLWKKTFDGLRERYRPLTPAIIDRVRHELNIIHDLGFAPYFLIMSDVVDFGRKESIPMVGRGSAANSVVAYALRITRADPFRYDLYFERFMNRSRTDCPDIDLDICWRRRDRVVDYVYKRYGADRVAMIGAHNTFRTRAAFREAAKALGMMDREITRAAKGLPHYHRGSIASAMTHLPECRGLPLDQEPLKSAIEAGEWIDGFPRHLSTHAAGLVITPEPLTHYVPLQRAAKGVVISQYDKDPIEALGLIKMDLLGHRSLTVLDDVTHAVRENRGIPLDLETLPDADPLTADLLQQGKTMACFQIESPAMRALLQKTRARDVHSLIQCVALVRPGASGSGMKRHFIDRRHGREDCAYLHPALEKVLGDTHGVMLYQEDVLKVAHAVAGMDLADADTLRRAMSKKRGIRAMAASMKNFLDKAQAQGVEETVAQEIWENIANFAGYAYCKAHAATYGELAYQCAYVKAHFPAEFFAAVLSNRGGFYPPPVYLEEAKRMGLAILPPHVMRSRYGYTAENNALRVGFVEVGGLGHKTIETLLATRPFTNIADLLTRAPMRQDEALALFQSGALDAFHLPRPAQLWQIKRHYHGKPVHHADEELLFPAQSEESPPFPGYSRRQEADEEWTALGLRSQGHPMDYHLPKLHTSFCIPSTALPDYAGQQVSLLGWLIAERRLGLKAGGGAMKFLTLEDLYGTFEAVLFSDAYQRYAHCVTTHGPFRLSGTVQEEDGAYTLQVEAIHAA